MAGYDNRRWEKHMNVNNNVGIIFLVIRYDWSLLAIRGGWSSVKIGLLRRSERDHGADTDAVSPQFNHDTPYSSLVDILLGVKGMSPSTSFADRKLWSLLIITLSGSYIITFICIGVGNCRVSLPCWYQPSPKVWKNSFDIQQLGRKEKMAVPPAQRWMPWSIEVGKDYWVTVVVKIPFAFFFPTLTWNHFDF